MATDLRNSSRLDTFVIQLSSAWGNQLEERIGLNLRPRPKWLPKFAWHWLAKKLLYLTVEKGAAARASEKGE